ncbi:MAG TPA: lipopolysaccharide assembly protein LapA domain-containing protein [Acidimicrobiia bacterium]|nr:lipopolysaccharide assembly protein LapA domain-containing protein [Acidimicrobiia bacterium]
MDESEFRDIDDQLEPEPQPVRDHEREGIPWGAVFLLIWAVLLIVFSVQNAENATVSFLGWAWEMPVALLVMVTALATLVLTGLGFAFYRRRRRRLREMKQSSRPAD